MGSPRSSLRFVAGCSVLLGAVTLLTAGSGLLRVVLRPWIAWLFVVSSTAAALAFDRWLVARCSLPRRPVHDVAHPSRERLWWALASVAALAYAFLWIPAYGRMDLSWDGLSYHVPTIHQWAAKGYVHWLEPPPEAGADWRYMFRAVFNGYPKGVETLAFLLARISGDKLTNAPNLVCLPLAFGASTLVARELGAARALSVAIALLFVLVPTNVGQSATTYVDTAFASAVMASLALGFVILRELLAGRAPAGPLVVGTGAAMGLALGDKAPGLAFCGILGATLVLTAVVRFRRRRARLKRIAASFAALALLAVSVGGIWYVRNWVHAGNPLNPIEVRIAGHVVFPGDDLSAQIGEVYQTPQHIKTWSMPAKVLYTWLQSGQVEWPIDAVKEHNERGYMLPITEDADPVWPRGIRGYDSRTGGLGFLWMGACVPAIVVAFGFAVQRLRRARASGPLRARVRATRALVLQGLFLIPILVLLKLMPMPWWARYTLWLYAPGLPMLALGMTLAPRLGARLAARGVQAAFAALLCVSSFEYLYNVKWSLTRDHFLGPAHTASVSDLWRGLTTTNEDGLRALWHEAEGLPRDVMSGDATIALTYISARNEIFVGRLSMPIGKRRLVPFDAEIGKDPEAAAKFVAKYLPRYVVWDHERYGPPTALLATARRWEWLSTMMLLELGDDAARPPLLVPE